jgi:type VI secretion system secreted protein Hcp
MAGFQCFIKIDNIDGECQVAGHEQAIEAETLTHSISNPVNLPMSSSGSQSGGQASIGELHFVKKLDSASPILFKDCCKGANHPTAKIEICRQVGESDERVTYWQFDLTDVYVISYNVGAATKGGDEVPNEEFVLGFAKIEGKYIPTNPETAAAEGNVTWGYDLKLKQKV